MTNKKGLIQKKKEKKIFMKRFLFFILLACCALPLFAGAAQEAQGQRPGPAAPAPQESGLYPRFVSDAVGKNAPEDVLVGIGVAKMSTLNLSRTTAQSRARDEITRQLNTISQSMVRDYAAGAESARDAANYQEAFTLQVSRADISGARVVVEDRDADGRLWCVVYLSKNDVFERIKQAAAAAKLKAPQAASIDAEERMNKAFASIAAGEKAVEAPASAASGAVDDARQKAEAERLAAEAEARRKAEAERLAAEAEARRKAEAERQAATVPAGGAASGTVSGNPKAWRVTTFVGTRWSRNPSARRRMHASSA
jgi:hypothetical protein